MPNRLTVKGKTYYYTAPSLIGLFFQMIDLCSKIKDIDRERKLALMESVYSRLEILSLSHYLS